MNKVSFINALSNQLKKIPRSDREDILYDYEEHFQLGLETGKSEEEIAEDLGNPKVIAKELLAEYMITQAESDQSVTNISRAIFATISLSFFNLIFLLGPIVAIIGVYISLAASAIAFTLSPLLLIVSVIFNGTEGILLQFFITLTLCGIGILLSIASIYIGKFLYRVMVKYVKFNVRIIKGGTNR